MPRPTRRTHASRRIVGALAFTALTFGAVTVPAQAASPSVSQSLAAPAATSSAKATIRSNDYPANFWGSSANYQGVLVLSTANTAGAVGFAYTWGDVSSIPLPTNENSLSNLPTGWKKATNGELRVTQPKGTTAGPKALYVKMFNSKLEFIGKTAQYSYLVPLAVPGGGVNRVEAENLKTTVTVRTAAGKTYGKGSLSFKESDKTSSTGGRRYLLATGGNVTNGPEFALSFTTTAAGNYAIGVSLAKAKNFGKLRFFVVDAQGNRTALLDATGKPITFDGYAKTAQRIHQPLGGLTLGKGTHRLVVKVVGRNPASVSKTVKKVADHGFAGAVDFLTVAPLG